MSKILFMSIIAVSILIGCTDRNVSQVTDKVFEVDGIYLKKVVIGGDHIYFVVDSLGNPIAGTSCTRRFNKLKYYATSIVPSDSTR